MAKPFAVVVRKCRGASIVDGLGEAEQSWGCSREVLLLASATIDAVLEGALEPVSAGALALLQRHVKVLRGRDACRVPTFTLQIPASSSTAA